MLRLYPYTKQTVLEAQSFDGSWAAESMFFAPEPRWIGKPARQPAVDERVCDDALTSVDSHSLN